MKRFEELLSLARWDAYRDGRHRHQRRRAFVCDVYKAVKGWRWSARHMPNGGTVLRLQTGDADKWDGFHPDDATIGGGTDFQQLVSCIERLTLEALQDVARATKNRLDSKPARP